MKIKHKRIYISAIIAVLVLSGAAIIARPFYRHIQHKILLSIVGKRQTYKTIKCRYFGYPKSRCGIHFICISNAVYTFAPEVDCGYDNGVLPTKRIRYGPISNISTGRFIMVGESMQDASMQYSAYFKTLVEICTNDDYEIVCHVYNHGISSSKMLLQDIDNLNIPINLYLYWDANIPSIHEDQIDCVPLTKNIEPSMLAVTNQIKTTYSNVLVETFFDFKNALQHEPGNFTRVIMLGIIAKNNKLYLYCPANYKYENGIIQYAEKEKPFIKDINNSELAALAESLSVANEPKKVYLYIFDDSLNTALDVINYMMKYRIHTLIQL